MNNGTKINQLLKSVPARVVLLSSWLASAGYPYELQQRYRKSGWLTSIGRGALKRSGDSVTLSGAVFSLQQQEKLPIHFGGRTALQMHGIAHYIEMQRNSMYIFAPRGVKLPSWVLNNKWEAVPVLVCTSMLPPEAGLVDFSENGLPVQISNPARAMLEVIYLVSDKFALEEAYQMMEGLSFLKPDDVQSLLELCSSVKVTRLFLFLAKKANHPWLKNVRMEKINLGKGKRSLFPGGSLSAEFNITLPKEML
jgi:hypothetical protein